MEGLAQAQAEVRAAYRSASVGQVYSGLVWIASAAAWMWASVGVGMAVLVVGGFLIYPVTVVGCRALGAAATIPADNPLREAGFAIPIVGALCIPAAAGAAVAESDWFFPAFMVVMGAHYLPFSHLYGMRVFVPLGLGMWAVGLVVGLWFPTAAAAAGAATGSALVAVGIAAARGHRREFAAG